jgi:hypothetical protein
VCVCDCAVCVCVADSREGVLFHELREEDMTLCVWMMAVDPGRDIEAGMNEVNGQTCVEGGCVSLFNLCVCVCVWSV